MTISYKVSKKKVNKPRVEIVFQCDRCGANQPKDEKQSNENWEVFIAEQKCECGGQFRIDFK